jgi:hypothetical protein
MDTTDLSMYLMVGIELLGRKMSSSKLLHLRIILRSSIFKICNRIMASLDGSDTLALTEDQRKYAA